MAKGAKTGGGSRKGRPNKVTADLRGLVLAALAGAGGRSYLQRQAEENPGAFLSLVGKCLPKDVNLNATVTLEEVLLRAKERQSTS